VRHRKLGGHFEKALLSRATLRGMYLNLLVFSEADFSEAGLTGTSFSGRTSRGLSFIKQRSIR
jgi:uncharacterized protein YjbI with pentapeptide repeats